MSLIPARRVAAAGSLALALGLLAACGGSSSDSSSAATTTPSSSSSSAAAGSASSSESGSAAGQAQTLSVSEADFTIRLDSGDLPAGDYTITVKNDGHATHDLVVAQNGADVAKSDSMGPGDSATFTVTLQPGKYVFYCSIGNHREMGMETAVTVS